MSLNRIALFAVVTSFVTFAGLAQEPAPVVKTKDAAADKPKPVYDEQADARRDIAAAVQRARRENRRVLIQWGANWCGWCKWLAATMDKDPKVRLKLMYEYDVVHVDVGHFDKNKDLAKELGAEFQAIPFLTIIDSDGKPVVQQNTEPFETKIDGKGGHDPVKLVEFLSKYQAEPRVAAAVMAAALAAAKAEHKRVFLHFGAPWCGWCHRLEDWMARPEIAALLQKDFVDCKIDNDRMAGGKTLYEAELRADGVKPSGIPWFVLLDEDGKHLAASNDDKGGTVGFPFQPDEVAVFKAMLDKARVHLTDADVQVLVDSLNQNRIDEEARRKAAAGK